MKFLRSKKLMFCNNKGGVGKTTLAFNCGVNLAKKGYKVALIDLDPQCNLTLQALGHNYYTGNLFSDGQKTIYDVLKQRIEGDGDIDESIKLEKIREGLYVLPGDIRLSLYEDSLINSYSEARGGVPRGYADTSAIQRYLEKIGLDEEVDIFIIDTSPSLGILNKIIFLSTDYFIVPLMPDSFSMQGIENLGNIFEKWEEEWKHSGIALAKDTPKNRVLNGERTFIGYVINSFNVYKEKMVERQREWNKDIPEKVKEFLSEKHSKNGLVEKSWSAALGELQDYGSLVPTSMDNKKAISEFTSSDMSQLNAEGTKNLHEKAVKQIDNLSDNIIEVLTKY